MLMLLITVCVSLVGCVGALLSPVNVWSLYEILYSTCFAREGRSRIQLLSPAPQQDACLCLCLLLGKGVRSGDAVGAEWTLDMQMWMDRDGVDAGKWRVGPW